MMSPQDMDREKVRWGTRRGMLECDLFLVPFFEQHYDSLSDTEKEVFKQLLHEPDPVLITWFMGTAKPTQKAYQTLIDKIRHTKLKV